MAITYVISAEHNNYENITVYDRLNDGVPAGWSVRANAGYVMYRSTDHFTEYDPETGEEVPVTYYYTESGLPFNYNWNNFAWVAVPRDSVDENYIFGGVDNDHEIM